MVVTEGDREAASLPAAYDVRFEPVSRLDAATVERMLELYESLYELPSPGLFRADLRDKDEVLLLESHGELVGFTTLALYDFTFRGVRRKIVYSGDTVVARPHWGQQALSRRWIGHVGELHRADPEAPIYWLLVVKGHRTYRYLATFCTRFHPHWELDDPDLAALADALARDRFGDHYDAESGIVRYPASRGHLRREIAHPSDAERALPAVAEFLRRNPGFERGDELVCLFEFRDETMRRLTRRIFHGGE